MREIIGIILGDFWCWRVERALMQVGDQLASCSNSLDNIQVEKEDQLTIGQPRISYSSSRRGGYEAPPTQS